MIYKSTPLLSIILLIYFIFQRFLTGAIDQQAENL